MATEERPSDGIYYEHERVPLFSQGDIFRDVPFDYPTPPRDIVLDEGAGESGARAFLSGPLQVAARSRPDPVLYDMSRLSYDIC